MCVRTNPSMAWVNGMIVCLFANRHYHTARYSNTQVLIVTKYVPLFINSLLDQQQKLTKGIIHEDLLLIEKHMPTT